MKANKVYIWIFLSLLLSTCGNKNDWSIIESYDNGKLKKKARSIDDSTHIEISYYVSGNVESKNIYINKLLDGEAIQYYDSAATVIQSIRYYLKGILNGPYYDFNKDNSLKYYCRYQDGKKIGDCISYRDNGEIEHVRNFVVVNQKSYLNQIISFSNSSVVNFSNSDFVRILFDTKEENDFVTVIRPPRNTFNSKLCAKIFKFKASHESFSTYDIADAVYSDSVCTETDNVEVIFPHASDQEQVLLVVELTQLDKKNQLDGAIPFETRTLYYNLSYSKRIMNIIDKNKFN